MQKRSHKSDRFHSFYNLMQFIFLALNNCEAQTANKNKLARWRHLDSLLSMALIIGLTFFMIMQNGKMREQIKQRLNNQVIEQIVNQRISVILEELNKMKTIIIDESNRIHTKQMELQTLVKSLSKQLGLPRQDQKSKNKDSQSQQPLKSSFYKNTYEVFEIYQGIQNQQTHLFPQEAFFLSDQDKDEGREAANKDKQNSYEICSYLQYWLQNQNQEIKNNPKKMPKYNLFNVQKMSFSNITAQQIGDIEQFLRGLKILGAWMGNAFVVIIFGISLLTMISFILNRKNKTKNYVLKHLLKKIGQDNKKRACKYQKQLLSF